MTLLNKKIGFIGIGLMGKPITLRLLEAGFQVYVWNRSHEKIKPVVDGGAVACQSVADVVNAAGVILLCLADTDAVKAVVENDIVNYGMPEQLIIDLSSIDLESTRQLAERVKVQCGMRWVDAPVSGGVSGAETGTLAIMAGGSEDDVAIAREILKPLCRQLTHMGEVGSGQTTKICNQMIVSCNVLVIAEMMALAQQAGVDIVKIPQALTGGFADSKPLQITGADMVTGTFEPVKWKVKTLLKDLMMAQDMAKTLGSSVPMSGLAVQLMQLHASRGNMDCDPATLIKLYTKTFKNKE
jgi:3-hydroxyisobutyrate dehydrogenase